MLKRLFRYITNLMVTEDGNGRYGFAVALPSHDYWKANKGAPWSLNDVKGVLSAYGIPIAAAGQDKDVAFLFVARRYAILAEYALLRAECPLYEHQIIDRRNMRQGVRYLANVPMWKNADSAWRKKENQRKSDCLALAGREDKSLWNMRTFKDVVRDEQKRSR